MSELCKKARPRATPKTMLIRLFQLSGSTQEFPINLKRDLIFCKKAIMLTINHLNTYFGKDGVPNFLSVNIHTQVAIPCPPNNTPTT